MPKAVVSPTKGLVQTAGSGFGVAASHNGPGYYHFVREIDLTKVNGGVLSAVNNSAISGVCQLPSSAIIFNIRVIVSEAIAAQATDIDLVAVAEAQKPASIGAAIASDTVLMDNGDLTGDTAFGDVLEAANAGNTTDELASNSLVAATKPFLYLKAGAGSNSTTAHTAGKILIHIEYYAAEAATVLDI